MSYTSNGINNGQNRKVVDKQHFDRGKSKKIMSLNKAQLSILIRHVTGHAHLDWHRKKMGDYVQYDGITNDYLAHINETHISSYQPRAAATNSPLDEVDINLASSNGTL